MIHNVTGHTHRSFEHAHIYTLASPSRCSYIKYMTTQVQPIYDVIVGHKTKNPPAEKGHRHSDHVVSGTNDGSFQCWISLYYFCFSCHLNVKIRAHGCDSVCFERLFPSTVSVFQVGVRRLAEC